MRVGRLSTHVLDTVRGKPATSEVSQQAQIRSARSNCLPFRQLGYMPVVCIATSIAAARDLPV
jgi:hypothetical protein